VLAAFFLWLDHRTGYKKLLDLMLLEHIPGGAKWRYVWGSCLAFVFSLQLVTGLLLMTSYSPGDSTAWGSVYYIQFEMDFGWLIRGLHHFGSQAMVVLLGLHMLQVVIAGAHLPPREINWWLGLGLMGVVLGLSLTGYLLPWDQKGYWATQVATSIAGNLPGIGSFVKRVLVGGPEYGNHTLTRFYALHVGVLPATLVILLVLHVAIFRRHGITAPKDAIGEGMFWPDQAFKDLIACLAIFGVLLGMVVFGRQGTPQPAPTGEAYETLLVRQEMQKTEWLPASERPADGKDQPGGFAAIYDDLAHAGKAGIGANLDAPADPQEQYPARPEWYFLFLFQLLKYFEGDLILVGTVAIPNGVGVVLFLLPFLGYGWIRPVGHVFAVLFVVAVLASAASLTCLALADDNPDPMARLLLTKVALAAIPALAGMFLLHLTLLAMIRRGAFRTVIFCAGVLVLAVMGLGVGTAIYAANTGTITEALAERLRPEITESPESPSEKTKKARAFRTEVEHAEKNAARAIFLAQAPSGVPEGGAAQLLRGDPLTAGRRLFKQHCAVCHAYQGMSQPGDKLSASDLTGFGSKQWIRALLENAGDDRFFGRTKLTGMRGWSNKHREYRKTIGDEIAALEIVVAAKDDAPSAARLAALRKELADYDAWVDSVAAWLASRPVGDPKAVPKTQQEKEFAAGYGLFDNPKIKRRCSECHTVGGKEQGEAPDLTGYGGPDWVRLMILAPAHPMRYPGRNEMPAFRNDEGPGAKILLECLAREAGEKYLVLSDVDRELIIRFLIGDERLVMFGRPITGPDDKHAK
jgi:quinol-cytochrome oxidoreductase complex cytochrome b subunit/mono/diheme cytochrome c family protein